MKMLHWIGATTVLLPVILFVDWYYAVVALPSPSAGVVVVNGVAVLVLTLAALGASLALLVRALR